MKETMPRDFLEEVRMKMASLHALAFDPQGRVSIEVANLTRPHHSTLRCFQYESRHSSPHCL